MDEAADEAGFGMADIMDRYIAGFYTAIPSGQRLSTVSIVNGEAATESDIKKVYDQILVPLSVRLDELNVPMQNRYAVLPPWAYGCLRRDARFIESDKSANAQALRTGEVGSATGFSILVSNNCPEPIPGQNVIQAGTNRAITVAEQINKTEAYRPQDSFSDAVKGLTLYGGRVFRPDSLVMATAQRVA